MRKIRGFNKLSKGDFVGFYTAIDEVAAVPSRLRASLETNALLKTTKAAKARAVAARRFAR